MLTEIEINKSIHGCEVFIFVVYEAIYFASSMTNGLGNGQYSASIKNMVEK